MLVPATCENHLGCDWTVYNFLSISRVGTHAAA